MKKIEKSADVGFISLLQLIFITLKLAKVIDWSWWWVLSPAWISLILTVAVLIIYVWLEVRE